MKTYPYNRTSVEGRRLFKLLDTQFNKGVLGSKHQTKTFESYQVPTVMQCRLNKARFLFASNLSGIKRPQVHIEADVEMAWGDFTENINALDFTHGQELPLTYVQPIEDDTMKMLIDAGLYRDERFEELMSKLMQDEVFDAEADMDVMYLNVGNELEGEHVPVLLVDPVNVVHEYHDESEHTTIQDLVKRSARLAIELRKEGVKTEELVQAASYEQDKEVFIAKDFEDVVTKTEQRKFEQEVDKELNTFVASSELLDQEIDVTDELKGSLGFDHTTEDDKIRELKDREREAERSRINSGYREVAVAKEEPKPEPKVYAKDADISDLDHAPQEQSNKTKLVEPEEEIAIDFSKGLDDYEYEAEDDGPEL